jgi:hypothetical protein
MQAWECGCSATFPSVLGKGKACSRGSHTGELWVNKACRARWVPWDLTPEICINNAASNSRLTAAGRQATATDTILRTVSRLFFFLFFSLPLMREQPNYTCRLKKLLKLYCIWTWDTWWGFFFVCVYSIVLLYASPLMRQLQNNIWGTISRIGDWDEYPNY